MTNWQAKTVTIDVFRSKGWQALKLAVFQVIVVKMMIMTVTGSKYCITCLCNRLAAKVSQLMFWTKRCQTLWNFEFFTSLLLVRWWWSWVAIPGECREDMSHPLIGVGGMPMGLSHSKFVVFVSMLTLSGPRFFRKPKRKVKIQNQQWHWVPDWPNPLHVFLIFDTSGHYGTQDWAPQRPDVRN